ncbi:MAG: sulfite exporter TauE/SafE family protein, partial [Streptomyces sp.]|nr:sulfite exporter TauE/SafE family protein [Streptomyces sp.]
MSTALLALAAGAVIGLALGTLGGGGSVLAVPALIYLLGFTPAAATTASLIIVTATSATALYAHARDGNVRWRTGALFAAAGLLPAALGGLAAGQLPPSLLTGSFALVAAVAALRMFRQAPQEEGSRPVRPGRAA